MQYYKAININGVEKMISNNKLLFLGIINIALLLLSHMSGQMIALLFSLFFFTIIIMKSRPTEFISLMMFNLPWAPLLKLRPEMFTFLTLVMPLYFLKLLLNKKKKVNFEIKSFLVSLLIIIFLFLSKLLGGASFDTSFLTFSFMLFFIQIFSKNYGEQINFEKTIYYYIIGILSSSFMALVLADNYNISLYIHRAYDYVVRVNRTMGFNGDPNVYSTQILVALAGLLLIMHFKNTKSSLLVNYILIILLSYLGFQSVSKMFFLVVVVVLILWMLSELVKQRNLTKKISLLLFLLIAVGLVQNFDFFRTSLDNILKRFGQVNDLSSFSTGRSDIAISYVSYILSNIKVLLIGQGFTKGIYIENVATHNTVLESVFQLGILGSIILVIWYIQLGNNLNPNIKYNLFNMKTLYYLIAIFLPWLTLDMLFSNDFFYTLVLSHVGLAYISQNNKKMRSSNEDSICS